MDKKQPEYFRTWLLRIVINQCKSDTSTLKKETTNKHMRVRQRFPARTATSLQGRAFLASLVPDGRTEFCRPGQC